MEAVLLEPDLAYGRRPITEDEARTILENPRILDVLIEEINQKVVGETDTIKTILLACFGSLVENNQIASYNLLVNSESGSGKDYIVFSTLQILPKDSWLKRTRITPNVFTYWHNPQYEPEWTWDGKICYLEDISDNVMDGEVFKVMCSSGSSATVLIKQVPKDIEIRGKPVFIITSANASPNSELTRRFVIVNLDESIDQTKAIMERQAKYESEGKSIKYNKTLIESLSYLERIRVKIPFAKVLPGFLPKNSMIMRTHFPRFMDYIKSSCALHQYQRETDEEGFNVAEGQDYDIAREVLLKLTSNPFMIPLTHNDKKLLDILEGLGVPISALELEAKISFLSRAQLYKILDKLAKYGFLEKSTREDEIDSRKNATVYSLTSSIKVSPLIIPTWSEIQEKLLKNENSENDKNSENNENDKNYSHHYQSHETMPEELIDVSKKKVDS
ncbi:MAG: hypothetical protein V1678_02905 [Candidatus Aenigmatarchaeota archaeon]